MMSLYLRIKKAINCCLTIVSFSGPHFRFKKERKKNRSQRNYSETLNNEYIERIHQMSYSLLFDNGMLQIFSFLIK